MISIDFLFFFLPKMIANQLNSNQNLKRRELAAFQNKLAREQKFEITIWKFPKWSRHQFS